MTLGLRYGGAMAGPVLISVAHFAALLLLLRTLPPQQFGLFSFILVIVQFCFGLSNALAGTPFTLRANQKAYAGEDDALFFQANGILSLAAGALCGGAAFLMGEHEAAALFGLYAGFAVLRWFWRSFFYALHKPNRAIWSDVAYAVILLAGLGVAWMYGPTLTKAVLAFCAAAGAALVCCGLSIAVRQISAFTVGRLKAYGSVWHAQSRWTLLGVVTTEATANSHAWLVTLIAGPAAFAPLAAASLFFRPVSLCVTSLTQLERPIMARALANGEPRRALQIMVQFRAALVAAWGATVIAALAVLNWWPSVVIGNKYELATVVTGVALWALVYLSQVWRTPDSVFLQADNRFGALAKASVVSAVVSISIVALLILFVDPVLSLLGILAGQIVMAVRISVLLKAWKVDHGT